MYYDIVLCAHCAVLSLSPRMHIFSLLQSIVSESILIEAGLGSNDSNCSNVVLCHTSVSVRLFADTSHVCHHNPSIIQTQDL